MGRPIIVGAVLVLVCMTLAMVAGCGSTSVSVKTPGGTLDIDRENGKVDVKTDKGELSVSTELPTEAELGVPVYPNAKMDENARLSWQDTRVAVLWTTDSPSKVIEWYKKELSSKPGYREMMSTENEALLATQSGNEVKMVTIGKNTVDHSGTTSIGIAATSGAPRQ